MHTAAKSGTRARAFAVAAAALLLPCARPAAPFEGPRATPRARVSRSVADTSAETRWVEETLRTLTRRERVGQLVMTAVQLSQTDEGGGRAEEARKQVTELGLGGVLVRGGNPESVATLVNELQRSAKVPLLVAADYERGLRMQMKRGTPFPYAMAVAATGDPKAAYTKGLVVAREARAVGVNWLLGPVADVNNNPDNPVINVRSYGEDPRRVAEFVAEFIRGARAGGALSTAKHFPGHGDTAVDTHIGLAAIRVDRARLERLELVPFRAAIKAGVDAVMTAHVALPAVTGDDVPATLSPKVTGEMLRRDLKFDGLVVTDSLGMGAITKGYPGGEAAVRAIKAGADVALGAPDARAAVDAIEAAVARGEITEARLDESVRRVLRAKRRVGLTSAREVEASAAAGVVERPEAVAEARRVAEHSITLLRNEKNFLPLDARRAARTLFVVVAADRDPEEGATFVPEIKARVTDARVVRVGPEAGAEVFEQTLSEAKAAEAVVVAAFVKRAAGKGTVALPDAQAEFVRRLISTGRPVAVIAFSGPYLIRQFPEVKTYATAYGIEEVSQAAGVRALFGEVPFRGRLPVSIPGLFPVGAGIRTSLASTSARGPEK
jgi:beta-N-acetylhexosaminidase